MAHVVFVCTGNAARSVMAGAMLEAHVASTGLTEMTVATAGTHVIEGLPMSWRTRDALAGLGLTVSGHRSRQLRADEVARADLIVGLAREHVEYVRRMHAPAAGRTATLRRLARDLSITTGPLPARVDALGLAAVVLEPWEDVEDPAGGDLPEFELCAREIHDLMTELLVAVADVDAAGAVVAPPEPA